MGFSQTILSPLGLGIGPGGGTVAKVLGYLSEDGESKSQPHQAATVESLAKGPLTSVCIMYQL